MWKRQTGRWPLRHSRKIVFALAVLLACGLAAPALREWRVAHAMSQFRAAPSRQHAARLTQWLDEGSVTRRQGQRILRLLLGPRIVTRTAYPVGHPIGVSVERPSDISITRNGIERKDEVWFREWPMRRREQSISSSGVFEVFQVRNPAQQPGIYRAELRTTCKIIDRTIRKLTLWDRLYARLRTCLPALPAPRGPVSLEPIYECRFTMPFDLHVVEADRAERLELITDPQTDQIMRAGITAAASEHRGIYETAVGRRGHRGSASVTFQTLPVAVAFELSLRLPDGRELPTGTKPQPQHVRVRAGDFGVFMVDVGSFGLTEPGEYAGTLVLRPDPDYAYEDAAIKSVWNGTLEFPISFFIAYVRTRTE